MIGRILVTGVLLVCPLTGLAGEQALNNETYLRNQISQHTAPRPATKYRESAKPKVNERAREFSPLADLKAEFTKLEPEQTILNARDDQFIVTINCRIRNVGNKPSTPTVARLRLESASQTTNERVLTKNIGTLDPGKNGHISWKIRLHGDRLQIRPKLNVRFYWRCEADPLPHEKGRFKRNNIARKYISVKAAYD